MVEKDHSKSRLPDLWQSKTERKIIPNRQPTTDMKTLQVKTQLLQMIVYPIVRRIFMSDFFSSTIKKIEAVMLKA